jgi:hypothetical protein
MYKNRQIPSFLAVFSSFYVKNGPVLVKIQAHQNTYKREEKFIGVLLGYPAQPVALLVQPELLTVWLELQLGAQCKRRR